MEQIIKYPRTPHLVGSEHQSGDDLTDVHVQELYGQHVILEEKLDGSNSGISFDSDANIRLQSRGHFLMGGAREKQFNLLKTWANAHLDALFDILSDRYVMYGEWLFCKHAVFYDHLPHYFFEFDIYDTVDQIFLSTKRRKAMLAGSPVFSVPVLFEGIFSKGNDVNNYLRDSLYKTANWKAKLEETGERYSIHNPMDGTMDNRMSEGLYIKVEDEEKVLRRMKYIRAGFRQTITETEHWFSKPILPNQLAEGVQLF